MVLTVSVAIRIPSGITSDHFVFFSFFAELPAEEGESIVFVARLVNEFG